MLLEVPAANYFLPGSKVAAVSDNQPAEIPQNFATEVMDHAVVLPLVTARARWLAVIKAVHGTCYENESSHVMYRVGLVHVLGLTLI